MAPKRRRRMAPTTPRNRESRSRRPVRHPLWPVQHGHSGRSMGVSHRFYHIAYKIFMCLHVPTFVSAYLCFLQVWTFRSRFSIWFFYPSFTVMLVLFRFTVVLPVFLFYFCSTFVLLVQVGVVVKCYFCYTHVFLLLFYVRFCDLCEV